MSRRHLAAPLALLLLAGRAAAGEPAVSEIPIPAIAPGPALTLAEALHQAEARSPSLAGARADIAAAEAQLASAWGTLLPVASGSLSYVYNDHADTAAMGGGQSVEVRRQDTASASLQLRVPLLRPRSWLATHAAAGGVAVRELGAEATRQALLLATAQAYMQALTARSLIAVQEAQIDAARRHLSVAEIRLRAGTGSRLDMIRAQTDLITALESLRQAHTAFASSRDALRTLTRADGPPLPVDAAAPDARSVDDEARLVDRALAAREDLKLARAGAELAERNVLAAGMAYLPSLDGVWQLDYQITDPAGFGSTDRSRWFLGLTLSVPLYDHASTAALQQSQAAQHRAELEVEQAELDAARAVRQARREHQEAVDLVGAAAAKATLARDAVALAEAAYASGTGGSLDVTDARRSSQAAEIELATRRLNAQLTWLELLRSTGEDLRGAIAGAERDGGDGHTTAEDVAP